MVGSHDGRAGDTRAVVTHSFDLSARREMRVFPVVSRSTELRPAFFDAVVRYFADRGFPHRMETVDYHFQDGANQMLRIGKRALG